MTDVFARTADHEGTPPRAVEPDAQGRRRTRRALQTTIATIVARGVGFLCSLAIVPLAVPHLGSEEYGIWMTMISATAFLSVANLGIGYALVSSVAQSVAGRTALDTSRLVGAGLVVCGGSALLLGVAFGGIERFVPWESIFNVSEPGTAQRAEAAAVVLVAFTLLSFPLALVTPVRQGLQEGHVAVVWETCGGVLTVVAVALATACGASLPALVAAAAAGPVVAWLAAWVHLLVNHPSLRPWSARVRRLDVVALVRSGSLFLVLQAASLVAVGSQNLVAAQVLGQDAVTAYAVPGRLAFAAITLVAAFAWPLWPAYADAKARGDAGWVRRTARRSLLGSLTGGSLAAIGLIACGGPLVRLWSRGHVDPSLGLLVALGLWIVVGSLASAFAALFNGLHVVGLQVVSAVAMAFGSVALGTVLAQRFGVAGIAAGTAIAYGALVLLPFAVLLRRTLDISLTSPPRTASGGTALAGQR